MQTDCLVPPFDQLEVFVYRLELLFTELDLQIPKISYTTANGKLSLAVV